MFADNVFEVYVVHYVKVKELSDEVLVGFKDYWIPNNPETAIELIVETLNYWGSVTFTIQF